MNMIAASDFLPSACETPRIPDHWHFQKLNESTWSFHGVQTGRGQLQMLHVQIVEAELALF